MTGHFGSLFLRLPALLGLLLAGSVACSRENPETQLAIASEAQTAFSLVARSSLSTDPPPIHSPPLFDLHVDTITQVLERGVEILDDPGLEASLTELERAGVGGIVEAVWVPDRKAAPDPFRFATERLTHLRARVKAHPQRWFIATRPEDLQDPSRVRVVLALEGGHALRSPADLDHFVRLGVRMIGLTWSFSNALCGSSGDAPPPGTGLTESGRAVVEAMNQKGIVIDVSHASDRCLEDILALSTAPVVASHSNARSVHAAPRNLTDSQLKAIARGGGVIGVMFHAPFVGNGSVGISQVVEHFLHIGRVAGWDHLGIGSDFDGRIKTPDRLKRATDLPRLMTALRQAGLSEARLEAVAGGNARRVLEQVWRTGSGVRGEPLPSP